jgi:hypothetical protein
MANKKISQLPLYTGNTNNIWFVMNDSGETTTYKVNINTIGSLSSSGTSGTSGSSGQAGSSGTSGTSGQAGSSGTSGTSGQGGSSGSSGTSGTSGTSGDSIFAQTGSFYNTTNNIGITGSLNVLGSGSFSSAVKFFSSASYGGIVQPGQFVTESAPVSQSNLYFSNPAGTNGQFPLSTNSTGSIVISGSNNIIFNSNRINTLVTNGTYGYINGYNNFAYNFPTLTTSSVALPLINQNSIQGTLAMGFTSSSLAVPFVNSNYINSQVTLNHQSGSVGFSANNILGAFTSTQQLTPGKNQSNIVNNVVINAVTLNHLSSSINYQSNIGGGLTVNNLVSSSVSAGSNGITVSNNIVQGGNNGIWASGSHTSGTGRSFNNNLIVGINNSVTASQVNSNNGNLIATAVLGQNLIISGSHSQTVGGSTFVGRYNGIDNGLDNSQNIVFAVGTGTGTSARRTGMWIDSGSNAVISGSLGVSGSAYIQSGSSFPDGTGSALVAWNSSTGQLTNTTYSSVLPVLMAVGAFYSTGSYTATANTSGSFIFDTSLNVNSVQLTNSGSKITVDRSGTYNIQFSTQISQGSGEGNIAIWLKKDGTNVADTATYVTVASNHKDVLALNLWDTTTSGSYYELAYQSDSNNTTFETVAATGNIPRSPSIILTVNQVR